MVRFFKMLIFSSFLGLSACMRLHTPTPELELTPELKAAESDAAVEPAAATAELPQDAASLTPPVVTQLNPQSINGAWRLKIGPDLCQIFTTHTKLNQGYRASTRLCPAPFNNVHGWQIKDNQLNLLSNSNEILVSLSLQEQAPDESDASQPSFTGTTIDGTEIVLSR